MVFIVTSNECIAGNRKLERSDTSQYIKELYKGSVSLWNNRLTIEEVAWLLFQKESKKKNVGGIKIRTEDLQG